MANGHCHYVWARDEAHALEIMAQRGMGEEPCGYVDPDELRASDKLSAAIIDQSLSLDATHALVYLCGLAGDVRAACLDGGWLHEAIHGMAKAYDYTDEDLSNLVDRVRVVEHSIPGHVRGLRRA